jgi:tetratricopeptide (TPR) repeat protein
MSEKSAGNPNQKGADPGNRKSGLSNLTSRTVLHVLLIFALGIIAYSNSFNVPFLLDDSMYITGNPTIKSLDYLADTERADYLNLGIVRCYLETRYVAYLSFWANYRMGGLNVTGYHAVNVLIHVINALLVYSLVRLIFRTPLLYGSVSGDRAGHMALFACLLFVSHPVQIQSVTYISQRFGEIATMFYVGALVAYAGSRLAWGKGKGFVLYVLSLAAVLLSMKSKEIAFTLPIAVFLFEALFFKGERMKRVVFLVPFLLMMPLIPVEHALIWGSVPEATRLDTDMPRMDYLFTQSRVIVTYLRLLLLPVNLNIDYDYPVHTTLVSVPVMLSFVLLIAVFLLGLLMLYRSRVKPELRLISFGIFWYFLTLSVESSCIPISEIIFEYRLYLPSVGAMMVVSAAVFVLLSSLEKRWVKWMVMTILVLVVAMQAALTYAGNALWHDDLRLWRDTVEKSPYKARPHNILGSVFEKRGLYEEAEKEYRAALAADPLFFEAHNNLGVLYVRLGRYDEAAREYRMALNILPGFALSHINLGVIYDKIGMHEEAIREFRAAVSIEPYNANAYYNMGVVYGKLGMHEKAEWAYRKVLSLDPDFVDALNNLGVLYLEGGRYEAAVEAFEAALGIRQDDNVYKSNLRQALNMLERDNMLGGED